VAYGASARSSVPAATACARIAGRRRRLPAPDDIEERPDFIARSVTLSSQALGIVAKMDLVEGEDGAVTPVDTKKGRRPHVAEGAYEPERVQVRRR
jgi:CRISPR-associated exonuclease Cas4/CRISPR-associated protein Cas1